MLPAPVPLLRSTAAAESLAALALVAPAFQTPYILIANKTSDAIAVTVNPVGPVTVVLPVGR